MNAETETANSLKELKDRIEYHQRESDWTSALSLLNELVILVPDDWRSHVSRGDAFFNLEDWQNAASAYKSALTIEGGFDWAWHNLSVSLFNLGDFNDSYRCYHSLKAINPSFWTVNADIPLVTKYANFISKDRSEGNVRQHELVPGTAIASSLPKPVEILYKEGQALAAKGRYEEAVTAYQVAVRLHPNHAELRHLLGDALLTLDRLDEAIFEYKAALKINPTSNWVCFNLGKALIKSGDPIQAVKYLREILYFDPNFTHVYLLLANTLEGIGQWVEATDIYRLYLEKVDPENIAVIERLNELLPQRAALSVSRLTQHLQKAYKAQPQETVDSKRLETAKRQLERLNVIALDSFIATNAKIKLPEATTPKVTIILVLYNRAELTFSCLNSILKSNLKSVELVIVDNDSSDRTRQLLARIEGAKIILNDENKHFLLACNQASELAAGEYLLFLNNDAQVLGNGIEQALRTIESSVEIGAVGGKVILPDGSLQEAGSIIWQDGSCLGYGRGHDPYSPEYMFQREVDYCSGAFLLTSRQLFNDLGGFDEAFKPAYYEETDYCVRVAKHGKTLVYDPDVVILHYEFASSSSSERSEQATRLQQQNRKTFVSKHSDWLADQQLPARANILAARSSLKNRSKVLFIEDRIPHIYYGSGHARGNTILRAMADLNCAVTLYPTDLSYVEEWADAYSDIPRQVEIMMGYGRPKLEAFLAERAGYYDFVVVSRPHNMEFLSGAIAQKDYLKNAQLIYDAEAIFCEREFVKRRLAGEVLSESYMQAKVSEEMALCKDADRILAVSEKDAAQFREAGCSNVNVLGHVLEIKPTPKAFLERKDFLFVGAIYEIDSPNADSVLWFSKEVFPKIQAALGTDVRLIVAGTNTVGELSNQVTQMGNDSIAMLGRVDDLTDLYNSARVFVVPTRFAAGIPHKAHEAAARGLPMVTTSLIQKQLGWANQTHLLTADTAKEFAKACVSLYSDQAMWTDIRLNSINQVKYDCNAASFNETIKEALLR